MGAITGSGGSVVSGFAAGVLVETGVSFYLRR